RWLRSPVTGRELMQAYRANALHDAHLEDPEFGYRFLADESKSFGSRCVTGLRGGSAETSSGGQRLGRRKPAGKGGSPARLFMTISCSVNSWPLPRTSYGFRTSPSIGRVKASSTCAR